MNIPTKTSELKTEDIEALAQTAAHEANPLYPVPVIFDAKQLEQIYHEIKQ